VLKKITESIVQTINDKMYVLNQQYSNEDELKNAIQNFFLYLDSYIIELISIYKKVKFSQNRGIEKTVSIKIIEKILFAYLLWLEKLESAIMGVGKQEAILNIDIALEVELIEYISKTSKKSCLVPMLALFGVGFLIGG